ncbi:MAG: TonB-dependent receptor, partial [Pseudomonadota bacterium]
MTSTLSRKRSLWMRSAASVAVMVGTIAPTVALAQDEEIDTDQITDEVVVFGRFQNSLINRLPIEAEELPYSIQEIDRDFIDTRGFIRPLEALQVIPNVVSRGDQFSSGGIDFLIRGFEASILVNNRPETSSRGFGRRDNAFVERYEVLKGPASISLGPVLPGGIINTVTKLPEADPFLDVEVRAGSFGTFRSEIDVNGGSLFGSDAVRGRATFAFENAQFANDIENRQLIAIRPVIEADLSSRTRSFFSVAYKQFDAVPGLNFAIFQDGTIPSSFTPETFFGPFEGVAGEGRDVLADAEVQHEFLDNLKLTLRGSYQDTDLDYRNTQGLYNYNFDEGQFGIAPSNPVGNFYSSTGAFDEEVIYGDAQLAWTDNPLFGGEFDVVVGGTYEERNSLSTFSFDGFNAIVDVINFDPSEIPIPDNPGTPVPFFDLALKTTSVYAEAIYRPTDWLVFVGGVRYDDLRNEIRDPTSGGDDTAADDFVQVTVEETDNVSFRIGGTATITDSLNVYASFAESFIPQSGVLQSGGPIGPETATSYEVGLKGSILDDKITINAALFNTLRQNVANFVTDPATQLTFAVPVGEQRHRGFEISA